MNTPLSMQINVPLTVHPRSFFLWQTEAATVMQSCSWLERPQNINDSQKWPHYKSVYPNTALNSYPYIQRKRSSNSSPEKFPFITNRGYHQRNPQLVKMHRISNVRCPTSAPNSECLYITTLIPKAQKHCERQSRKIVNGGGTENLWLDSVSIFVSNVSP